MDADLSGCGRWSTGKGRLDRLAGPKQRLVLGTYPDMSLASARTAALSAREAARQGYDPAASRTPQAPPKGPETVAQLIGRYAKGHLRRNMKAGAMVETLLERHVLPAWGDRAVADLTRGDLLKLLEDVRQPRQTEVTTRAVLSPPCAAAQAQPSRCASGCERSSNTPLRPNPP